MAPSDRLVRRIKADEGFKAKAYRDEDGWSIGYGHHTKEMPRSIVTREEAHSILIEDLLVAREDCVSIYFEFSEIDEPRQEALINMSFNMGGPTLRKFKKHIQAVDYRDWEAAAEEAQDSRWYDQVGGRAKRIVRTLRTGEPNDVV